MSIASAVIHAACAEDFSPYNELSDELRILAIRAQPQAIGVGENTQITGLVYTPPGAETPAYRWSWCPLTLDLEHGYECAVDESELQALLDDNFPPGTEVLQPFDLGTNFTASLTQGLSLEALTFLCENLVGDTVGDFVEIPNCSQSFKATIRLRISLGQTTIFAVKAVDILIDPWMERNENPNVEGLTMAIDSDPNAPETEIPNGVRTRVAFATDYRFRADINPDVAELYGANDTRENLLLSWFYSAGETEFMRTSYLPGEISLETASQNTWSAPQAKDYDGHVVQIVLVIRDDRGGTGWLTRELVLQ